MKLLILTNEFALPVNAGGVRRQVGLYRALADHHELTILAREREPNTSASAVAELAALTKSRVELFPKPDAQSSRPHAVALRWARATAAQTPTWALSAASGALVARARELASDHDCMITIDDTSHTYVERIDGIPVVIDKSNVLTCSRGAAARASLRSRLEHQLLTAWERRTVGRAGAVVVTSDREAERFTDLYGYDPVVIASAIPTPTAVARPAEAAPVIVWLGDLRYSANSDGLLRFLRDGWPDLGRSGASLRIVGRDPSPEVATAATQPGVELCGFVDDLGSLLATARAAVVPLWAGAGIKMKTLELMGAGLPVVGTTVAFEGLQIEDGVDSVVRESAEELGRQLQALMAAPLRAAEIGTAAHTTICAHHTWDGVASRYAVALERAIAAGPATRR